MDLPTYFTDFLREIRLDNDQDCQDAHTTLRKQLLEDADWGPRIVSTFLQGSYRRSTIVKPSPGNKADVDVVVVTNLDEHQYTPKQVLDLLVPFLDRHYSGQWEPHDRSVKIKVAGTEVELDLVVTAAPSEAMREVLRSDAVEESSSVEDDPDWLLTKSWLPKVKRSMAWNAIAEAARDPQWKTEPLRIPSRDLGTWEDTDPLAQIRWTREKNSNTSGFYINVVKSLKWWRRRNPEPKYPKGYPMEHLIGQTCPDGIDGVALGIVRSLEDIRDRYPTKPYMLDHGVAKDVFARVSDEDYLGFHQLVKEAAGLARQAYDSPTVRDSALLWRELLGPEFPVPEEPKSSFTTPSERSNVGSGRFGGRRP
jgi:hypothetical protein